MNSSLIFQAIAKVKQHLYGIANAPTTEEAMVARIDNFGSPSTYSVDDVVKLLEEEHILTVKVLFTNAIHSKGK